MSAPGARRLAAAALVAVLAVAFALAAHAVIVRGVEPRLATLLALVPATLVVTLALRRARRPGLAVVAVAALAAGVWLAWPVLQANFRDLFFVQHAAFQLALAALFGHTLVGGREPLVARFARIIHGPLKPEVARYTRRVTIVWTTFFATLFALSCALFLAGRIEAWSLLVNVASPLLVALAFVVESAVRRRALPAHRHVGILGSIRAFRQHFEGAPLGPR